MCSEVAVRSFLYLNRILNSHRNSFILITTVLVLSQRAVHQYLTGSSSCTTEATVSLIIPFSHRNFLYFVFCIVHLHSKCCMPSRQGTEAVLEVPGYWRTSWLLLWAVVLAEVRVKGGKVSLCLVIWRG